MWDRIEEQLPDEPHWFLDAIAVERTHRSQGIGSALVRWGLERAVTDGVPAFLETGKPRNVPYYERFGFHIAHEDDAPDGGPHIWFMRLDP